MIARKSRYAWPLLLAVSVAASGCVGQFSGGEDLSFDGPQPDEPAPQSTDPFGEGRQLFFYYGPMKLLPAESILYTLEQITGHDFGGWDYTAPDPTRAGQFSAAGNDQGDFYVHCRLLGGCMEHRIPLGRTSFVGTAYVLQLEKAVVDACNDLEAFGMFPGQQPPGPDVTATEIIEHQYRKAFATAPTPAKQAQSRAYFEQHLADPETDGISPMESAGRGHCRALLATNRFIFY